MSDFEYCKDASDDATCEEALVKAKKRFAEEHENTMKALDNALEAVRKRRPNSTPSDQSEPHPAN